jgi:2-dehydro-3-deoxyphosphogluconate aldolase/(4S)-4-hydroxy-2-oxoglutarate aldolase
VTDRTTIVNEILDRRVSAIVRTKEQRLAADAMRAAIDGGFRLIEFTMTTPGALELITEFARKPDLLVGAGTVLTVEQARAAVEAGARFLVSPICDPEVISEAHKLGAPAIPGTFTATEMEIAHRAGADFVKLFPAPADLPAYIASILAPLPHLRIYPTNGVTVGNLLDVLRSGAAGAGFASALFDPAWLADRDFAAIRRCAAAITRQVAST